MGHPRVGGNPVYLPALAAVGGVGLFEVSRVRGNVRDDKSNENRSTIQIFLVEELAATVFELPDRRLAQCSKAAVGEIQAPLMGIRIEKAQRQSLDMPGRAIHLKLDQIRASAPDGSHRGGTVVF